MAFYTIFVNKPPTTAALLPLLPMMMIMQYNNKIGIAAMLQLQKKKNLTQQLDLRKNVHPRETTTTE